jgi:hypothetical protein
MSSKVVEVVPAELDLFSENPMILSINSTKINDYYPLNTIDGNVVNLQFRSPGYPE